MKKETSNLTVSKLSLVKIASNSPKQYTEKAKTKCAQNLYHQKLFSNLRRRLAYEETGTIPNLPNVCAKLSQVSENKYTKLDEKILNVAIRDVRHEGIRLTFLRLKLGNIYIRRYTDASFVSNRDFSS